MVGEEGRGDSATAADGQLAALDVETVVSPLSERRVAWSRRGRRKGRGAADGSVIRQELARQNDIVRLASFGGFQSWRWKSGRFGTERQEVADIDSWGSGRVQCVGSVLSWALWHWGPELGVRHVARSVFA